MIKIKSKDTLKSKKTKSSLSKINDLKKHVWGLGIEHEMHIFHKPKITKNNIKDFTIFNSYDFVQKILEEKENSSTTDLSYDDYIFLKDKVPFETSGRRCNDKWVIKAVPVKMPEFITFDPFCSIEKDRDIKNMTNDIVKEKERFYEILMRNKDVQKLVKKYGEFSEYPFGMTRYLKCPKSIKSDLSYSFENDKNGNPLLLPEYNGSYHITMTLPHKKSITNKKFIKIHQNFCNQLQWLEPLLLTAYFSGDEYAPGSLDERVRGSFRVMIIGWGNLAGTDVRLLEKGIGRYAKTPTYWRTGLEFKDVNKLKPCYKPSPMAKKENAITSLSSDFRTFGSTDPSRPMHRESGIGMTKPNGIEFRIFDHFSDKYITHLLMLISLVAENSRVTETKGYVYENKIWIKELHNIMKNGYKAQISKKYVDLLRSKLGLKINTSSIIAIDIFKQIYKELWDKNIDGDWTKIFHSLNVPEYDTIVFPEVNKKAWQFAFMVKLNNNPKLLDKFNMLSKYLNENKDISFTKFSLNIIKLFGERWRHDDVDIAYFYDFMKYDILEKYVKLTKNEFGIITRICVVNEIPMYKNFNTDIVDYFSDDVLRNI
jgi:hypothetical protein